MKSKYEIDDIVMCDGKECNIMDKQWVEHMDEFQYQVGSNSKVATVLERDIDEKVVGKY